MSFKFVQGQPLGDLVSSGESHLKIACSRIMVLNETAKIEATSRGYFITENKSPILTKFLITLLDITPQNLTLDHLSEVWCKPPPVFESAALSDQVTFYSSNDTVLSLIPQRPDEELQLECIS
ncbi:Aminoglycoside phosphotransferase [Penicillium cosmopolitanum]|uniref:Aminoglycoside phosphotransferase n=1 Tax=Penicillium cosmopolitanum TaxID=1131564 RepID=A0A9W9SCF3_9EURO|nr:Aminoglycoside phosphotransferase [Penicillium cosmopolitanum]KAJ5376056.1 Aminoglycoside phosphotransferase [Penicillium cosmopolitanum]